MGDPWGRGSECLLCCHWPERERGRRRGRGRERERERQSRVVSHMWKKTTAVHTQSRDYPSAFRSDGGHAGMNR